MILESSSAKIILKQRKAAKLYKEIEAMRNVGHESKFHRDGKYSKVGADFGLGDVIPSTYVDTNANYDAGGGGDFNGEKKMFDKKSKFGMESIEKKEMIIPVLTGVAIGTTAKFVIGISLVPSVILGFLAAGIGSGLVHHMNAPKSPLLPPAKPIAATTPPIHPAAIPVQGTAFKNPPGINVLGVQHSLNIHGFGVPSLVEDGKAGPKTADAVKKAQASYGLAVTGVIDAALVSALQAADSAQSAPSNFDANAAASAQASAPTNLVPPLADLQ
jgi:Putative peptidoglycan binding domain